MTNLNERHFHLLMGVLFVGSTFFDTAMRAALPSWNPPVVTLTTLVLGLIWVGLFAAYRGKNLEDRTRVLADRLDRTERKVEIHDADLADRHRPLL